MDYLSVSQYAKKYNISERTARNLLETNTDLA